MKLTAIVAAAENGVIGKDNRLIWRLPLDMQFFKEKTMGHCIATGRKNYESIPEKFRPLPGRTNIIITRNKEYKAPGAVVVDSIDAAIGYARAQGETELFIIGGADVFRQIYPRLDKIYFTRVYAHIEGDVYFDDPDPAVWEKTWEEFHPADEKHAYSFTFMELVRKK